MADILFAAAALLLAITAAGLAALWRAGRDADRMLAVQLLGSAGVAVMLLLSAATGAPSILDVALLLSLLAALAACAYRALGGTAPQPAPPPVRRP